MSLPRACIESLPKGAYSSPSVSSFAPPTPDGEDSASCTMRRFGQLACACCAFFALGAFGEQALLCVEGCTAEEEDGDMELPLAVVPLLSGLPSAAISFLSGLGGAYATWTIARSCRVEFGRVDLPRPLAWGAVAVGLALHALLFPVFNACWWLDPEQRKSWVLCLAMALSKLIPLTMWLNFRGFSFTIVEAAFLLNPFRGLCDGWYRWVVGLGLLWTTRARYLRDHRIIVGLVFGAGCYANAGSMAVRHRHSVVALLLHTGFYLVVGSCCMGAGFFVSRHKRRLPVQLRHCKFVRLGFLREAVQAGLTLRRCQDLPPEAFGDVEKAAVLLIVSHRWLDRFKCDLPAEGFPHGLRLTTMTRRLNDIFPAKLFDKPWRQTLESMRYGGDDVLVFFDFMSLPQIGQDPVSCEVVHRTEKEADIFFNSLPHMGALYTMYPVLVQLEVTPDVAPYDESGWCLAEFCSAMLTKQLNKYSAAAVKEYMGSDRFSCISALLDPADDASAPIPDPAGDGEQSTTSRGSWLGRAPVLDARRTLDFVQAFTADLNERSFFDEGDRVVAHLVVLGSVVIRRLADAVRRGAEEATQCLLERVRIKRLHHVLDHAVDDSLDTLLHVAVKAGSRNITKLLLDAGCSPRVRNYVGDRPDQWLLLPRCSQAAALSRGALALTRQAAL